MPQRNGARPWPLSLLCCACTTRVPITPPSYDFRLVVGVRDAANYEELRIVADQAAIYDSHVEARVAGEREAKRFTHASPLHRAYTLIVRERRQDATEVVTTWQLEQPKKKPIARCDNSACTYCR